MTWSLINKKIRQHHLVGSFIVLLFHSPLKSQSDFINSYGTGQLICERELSNSDYFLLFSNTLIRTNNIGTPIWTKFIAESTTPGNSASVQLTCSQQTSDGGFIITGGYYNSTTLDYDALLVKIDNTGAVQWSKSFGGVGKDCGLWVEQTSDGGYVLCGTKDHSGFSYTSVKGKVYVVKTDNTGNIQWERAWSLPSGSTSAQNIKQTTDGGYIVTGNTGDEQGLTDTYLIKLNNNGNITWQQEYHVNCYAGNVSSGREVWEITNGFIVGGFAGGENGSPPSEAMFLKTNSSGDVDKIGTYQSWTGVPGFLDLGFASIDVTNTGEFVGTGGGYNNFGPLYILKADANLNMLWSRTYWSGMGGPATGLRQTADLGYALVDGGNQLLKTDQQGMIHCYIPGAVYSATSSATKHNLPLTIEPNGTQKNLSLISSTVTVNTFSVCPPQALQINITSVNISCNGDDNGSATVNITNGTAPYAYTWSPGGANTQTINNLSPGIYTVTVTDNNGTTSTASVTINEPPVLTVNIQGGSVICEGQSTSLNAVGAGGTPNYSYMWNTTQNGNSINVSPNVNTNYSVIITDANGCTAEAEIPVTVNTLPVIVFTSDVNEGCGPLCVNFTNTTPNSQSLSWDFGDGTPGSPLNPIKHCYTNPGSYNVSLTVTDGNGCSNILVQNNLITVYAHPVASFTMNPQTTSILSPEFVFTDLSIGATAWDWSFGDDHVSAVQHPKYTYNDTGTYTVQLIVINDYGCKDTAVHNVRVNADYIIYIPNTFTPNGDGLNEIFMPAGMGIDVSQYAFWIFDRWGNLIFETRDTRKGWNGRANGGTDIAQIDTYIWKIALTDILGQKHQYIGHVNLIR